ncbi:MAG: hypothetical protein KDC07_03095 [Chitinophagaceae bacterium]|nr:hypothetical protein [Chitinophagaceae bacterium]MCB9045357.1 hypothetical protein [Chitinophagales bacterium]
MLTGIQHLHNFLRWFIIIFALWTIIKSMSGIVGNKQFTSADKRPALFLMITADIQLLLGLILYAGNGWFKVLTSGGFMKLPAQRFWAMEHMFGMLVGIILIHIGYSAIKKPIEDTAKFKKVFWFTLVAFIIIMATIPWPFREAIGRGLFPGMH